MRQHLISIAAGAVVLVSGCKKALPVPPAPPQVTSQPALPTRTSTLVAPVTVSLDALQRVLEAKAPRQLWTIDEQRPDCVQPTRIKAFGTRIGITPRLGCRIVGTVTRGPISLTGSGRNLTLTLPVHATIGARRIGGIGGVTGTGSARARAQVRFALGPDWQPTGTVTLAYDWTDPPGITVAGKRITFTSKADAKLKGVIANLQRQVRQELARVPLRPQMEALWRQGFTVIQLNGKDPPAWMRVTPVHAGLIDYRVAGRQLIATIAAEATTETFIGHRPADPKPTPLPPQSRIASRGLSIYIPVLADYDQLEWPLLRALRKRAAKGITVQGLGPVDARFNKVTIYATQGGRIAVGIDAVAAVLGSDNVRRAETRGRVWLTGVPYNAPDSQVIRIRDLQIFGSTDRAAANLLMSLMLSDAVRAEIEAGIAQDFGKDYRHVLDAARKAITRRRQGDVIITTRIDAIHHAVVQPTGSGLFLPVEVTGTAQLTLNPHAR